MALEDILAAPENAFPAPPGGTLQVPSTNPRLIGSAFRTANGYYVTVEHPGVGVGDFPPLAVRWVEDAFNACGYDVARCWCYGALWADALDNGGEVNEPSFHVHPTPASDIPNFGYDFVRVDLTVPNNPRFYVWDGLATAAPPFGGRRFFMETVLHAMGHYVGQFFAVGDDLFKRKRICEALCADRVRGGAWGYGVAWRMWGDTTGPWAQQPQERFAEAFKDIWGDPTARTFVNRTRAPYINQRAIMEEAQVYLPINRLNLPPNPGVFSWRGFSMQQRRVPAFSISDGCIDPPVGRNWVCYRPSDGAGPPKCVGCNLLADPNLDGLCATDFGYPTTDRNFDTIWSVRARIPRIGFCKTTIVTYGGPLQSEDAPARSYQCPGIPGVGAQNLPVKLSSVDAPLRVTDGTYLTIRVSKGSDVTVEGVPAGTADYWLWGTSDYQLRFVCHVEPVFGGFAGVSVSNVSFDVAGWSRPSLEQLLYEPDSFDFLADPFYVGLGYHHTPGSRCYMIAPSTGRTFLPYGQLNLDGFAQGAARAPVAAGQEGNAVRLDTGRYAGFAVGPTLRVEGS